jgi:hypothetical protein
MQMFFSINITHTLNIFCKIHIIKHKGDII